MIKPICRMCGNELKQPGALFFSPPMKVNVFAGLAEVETLWDEKEEDGASGVSKWHLCVDCHEKVRKFITGEK